MTSLGGLLPLKKESDAPKTLISPKRKLEFPSLSLSWKDNESVTLSVFFNFFAPTP